MGDDAVAAVDAEADSTVSGNGFRHITVLLHETVDMLKAGPGKFIVDCTLGGRRPHGASAGTGRHRLGALTAMRMPRRAAILRLARFGSRFKALAGNFQDVESILSQQGVSRVDGLLADLGVSSHQLDTASRGFSFREDGPLDMRMDTRAARRTGEPPRNLYRPRRRNRSHSLAIRRGTRFPRHRPRHWESPRPGPHHHYRTACPHRGIRPAAQRKAAPPAPARSQA